MGSNLTHFKGDNLEKLIEQMERIVNRYHLGYIGSLDITIDDEFGEGVKFRPDNSAWSPGHGKMQP